MQESNYGGVLRYRQFRLQHNIPLRVLAAGAGVSLQRISQLELLEVPVTAYTKKMLTEAMEDYLFEQNIAIARALSAYRVEHEFLFDAIGGGA